VVPRTQNKVEQFSEVTVITELDVYFKPVKVQLRLLKVRVNEHFSVIIDDQVMHRQTSAQRSRLRSAVKVVA